MKPAFYRPLEFDRVREALAAEALTALGRSRALDLEPATAPAEVRERLALTAEAVAFVKGGGSLSIDAPDDLERILTALDVIGEPLEPLQLVGLCRFVRSVTRAAEAIRRVDAVRLRALVAPISSFADEVAAVERAVDTGGDVLDTASPALRDIREKLRRQRSKLRSSLEALTRGRDTAKYLQDQIITDRNGRYVVVVRSEHRDAIPGLVHGSSASGASLYLEPLSTVSLNNDVVALVEREREEVHRVLLALSNAFRLRGEELEAFVDAAADIDAAQARARLARRVDGVAPAVVTDGRLVFKGARHPLLIPAVRDLLDRNADRDDIAGPRVVVASDLAIEPPVRALVISGPNTGGKTVALKAFGLLALMAQSGLFIPVEDGSAFTPFTTVFADIGDEQSISASLSTFSARIANIVEMERALLAPALVLLDEVGSGTDPVEGGALGTAVIDHFRRRGAMVVATTHDDALKSYAATTDGVAAAAFGFNPDTYAPTYRLMYGAPGRSLALEVAERLGMPESIVADARARRSTRESQLAAHLARADAELAALERAREAIEADRAALRRDREAVLAREARLAEREAVLKKRFDDKLGERLREARAEVDAVVSRLRHQAEALTERASKRSRLAGPVLSTGEIGELRAGARQALDAIGQPTGASLPSEAQYEPLTAAPEAGARVFVSTFGAEGIVKGVSGRKVDVEVRGKRVRVPLDALRRSGQSGTREKPAAPGRPAGRAGAIPDGQRPTELMVIGATVDEAIERAEKFLDDALLSDTKRLRVVHGHGTGRLREALTKFFREHPLVATVERAPDNEGGAGATIVELKD